MRPLGAGGIEIHARDAGSRKAKRYEMLQLLGAEAAHALDFLAAHATRGRDRRLMTAVMAAQRGRPPVRWGSAMRFLQCWAASRGLPAGPARRPTILRSPRERQDLCAAAEEWLGGRVPFFNFFLAASPNRAGPSRWKGANTVVP